jgi:hypothetical protein
MIRLSNNVIRLPNVMQSAADPFIHWVRNLLPSHRRYVETHGPQVLLGKERTATETVNDVGGDIVTFFSVLRDHDLSSQLVELVVHPRGDRHKTANGAPVAVQSALRFFERCRRSCRWGVDFTAGSQGLPDRLAVFAPICHRLRRVQIEQLPILDLLQRYDRPLACFVVDATGEVGVSEGLLESVRGRKGRVILLTSGDVALDGWRKVAQPAAVGIPIDATSQRFAWMNFSDPRESG